MSNFWCIGLPKNFPIARQARKLVPATIRRQLKTLIARPVDLKLTDSIWNEIWEFYLENNPKFEERWGIRYSEPTANAAGKARP